MMTRSIGRPYPGSRPFAQADVDHFFGRSDDAETLAGLWRVNRLTLAIGHTGGGKTSLLEAGVIPLVRHDQGIVLPPGRIGYGSGYPVAAMPEHNPYSLTLMRCWAPGEPVTALAGLTIGQFVRRQAERQQGPVLAVVDQAEDLLADSSLRKLQRQEFLSDLAATVQEEPRLHLLLMIRESAVSEFTRALGNGVQYHVPLLPFPSAVEAVMAPVGGTGRTFDPEAAGELVRDLLTSYISVTGGDERCVVADDVQPALLQVACARLWDSLPEELDTITTRDVHFYGDADQALAAHCGHIIAAVAEEHSLQPARLRSWLIRTFISDAGAPEIKYEGRPDTAGMPNAVLRALEDRHLLASERLSGLRSYQLLSERLIEPLRHSAAELPPPVDPRTHLLAAQRALTLGELSLAERHGEQVLRPASNASTRVRAQANTLLGNVAHERGQPGVAEARYWEAAQLFEVAQDTQAVAQHLVAVGQTLLTQGRGDEAVSRLEAALRRAPHDLLIKAELAWAHWQLGQADAAASLFTEILDADAGNAGALRGRGEILAYIGKSREAMRDLSRTPPHDKPSTRAARGLAMAELGEYGPAAKEIEAALEQAPRNGSVLLYAARAEALGGHAGAAAERARQAISASDPPLPLHQRDQAWALVGQTEDDRLLS
jgi:tetratricopeptide (TPR) repeat protein